MGIYDSIENRVKNLRSKRDEVARVEEIRAEMQEINDEIREQIYLIGQFYWKKYFDGEYAPGEDKEYFDRIDLYNEDIKNLINRIEDSKVLGLIERESIDNATRIRIEQRDAEAAARRKQRAEEKERQRIEKENLRIENAERQRIEKEERDRLAAQRAAEKERLAAERAEKAKAEKEERDRLAAQKAAEKERAAAERAAEKERLAAEKAAERARIATEKAERAKAKAEAKKSSDDDDSQ